MFSFFVTASDFMPSDLPSLCVLWDADVDKQGGWRDSCSIFWEQVDVAISWESREHC